MNMFLTGANGFVGSQVAKEAMRRGHQLRLLTNIYQANNFGGKVDLVAKRLHEVTPSDFSNIDALIHLAAFGVNPISADWSKCFQTNVVDSLKCWRNAVDGGVCQFLICGSCFEYGLSGEQYENIPASAMLLPVGPYASSKAAATMAALGLAVEKNLNLLVVRPFHVFGEGEPEYRFWPSLRKAAISGSNFDMTKGNQVRDFIYVGDLAVKIIDLIENGCRKVGQPEVKNLGSGRPLSLIDFANSWWEKWGAVGSINSGAIPYRSNEVMRYVPCLK
jgi:nucleoside-diphosphate-sugar epimerase